jgi:hypothetical protein
MSALVAPLAANVVALLVTYNTIAIPAGETYQLVTSENPPAGPFYFNVLNLGPGAVYLSDQPGAAFADSETLPANFADNGIFISQGTTGLYVTADVSGATISVRVALSVGVW